MFYNLGIAGRAMRRIGADRVRHDDRARSARRAAHRQDQGIRGPRRQEQAAGLRRHRGRFPADGSHRPVPRRDQGRRRSGQGRAGAFAERGCGQTAALRADRDSSRHAAGGAADPGDRRGHRGPAGARACRSAASSSTATFRRILQPDDLAKAADGVVDADAVRADLTKAGITLSDTDFAGLLTETIEHATRIEARAESAEAARRDRRAAARTARHQRRCRPRQPLRARRSTRPAGSPMMSTTPRTLDMASILADRSNRVVVCCGAGGVGKTTTAAAMALRAAEYGRKVVVLTIDPARRLAQALGVKDLGNSPQRVPLDPEVPGELHAMMLDMRRTFDEMVLEHSEPGRARSDSGEPVLSDRGHVAGGHAGVHGDGEAGPAAGPGQVGSGGGRHPAVAQRAGLPGRPQTAGQLHGRPAVADAAGTGPRHRAGSSPARSGWR